MVPAGRQAPRGLLYVGGPDPVLGGTVTGGGIRKDLSNFAPRLGFAYAPALSENGVWRRLLGDGRTVIRGGYGIFYGTATADTFAQHNNAPGFNGTAQFSNTTSGTRANPFAPDQFPLYCKGIVAGVPQSQCPRNVPPINNPFASQLFVSAPLATALQPIDPEIQTPYLPLTISDSSLT